MTNILRDIRLLVCQRQVSGIHRNETNEYSQLTLERNARHLNLYIYTYIERENYIMPSFLISLKTLLEFTGHD